MFEKRKESAAKTRRRILNWLILLGCIILIIINLSIFIMTPRSISGLGLIISNIITLAICALAFKPLTELFAGGGASGSDKLYEQVRRETSLEREVSLLQSRNRELENRLNSRDQASEMPSKVNFTFKVESLQYSKKGYIVKEDLLDSFSQDDRYSGKIPEHSPLSKLLSAMKLKEDGVRKILYIKKNYYKASVGIDFTKIKYAFGSDGVLFSGVEFTKLYDISSEMHHDGDDIEHCWIIEEKDGKEEILRGDEFDSFKNAYRKMQDNAGEEAMEEELTLLCKRYTEALRSSLKERYPYLEFVDGDAVLDSDKSWYALGEGSSDRRITEAASSMVLLSDAITKTLSEG